MSDWRRGPSRRVSDRNFCNTHSERDNVLHPKIQPEGNYILVRIGKYTIDALIDSGAVRSLISELAAKFLKLKIQPINQQNHKPGRLAATQRCNCRIIFQRLKSWIHITCSKAAVTELFAWRWFLIGDWRKFGLWHKSVNVYTLWWPHWISVLYAVWWNKLCNFGPDDLHSGV